MISQIVQICVLEFEQSCQSPASFASDALNVSRDDWRKIPTFHGGINRWASERGKRKRRRRQGGKAAVPEGGKISTEIYSAVVKVKQAY